MILLNKEEHVIHEIRRHWYVLLTESIGLLILFFIPWLLFIGLDITGVSLGDDGSALFVFISALWFLILWFSFSIIWTNYYLDAWFITDSRVIDVEQHGLFNRDVSEFRLDKIQDVTLEIKGFLPTMLHFGDIHVQTAGEAREFVIRHVPYPYHVKEIIIKEHNKAVVKAHGGDKGL